MLKQENLVENHFNSLFPTKSVTYFYLVNE